MVKRKKTKTKQEDLIFNLYADQLDKWCVTIDNKKVLAIQKYVHKGTVLADLVKEKVIPVDDNGELLTNWIERENKDKQKPELFNVLTKEQGKFEIRKALVVWSVQIPGDFVPETWKDKEVQQSWGNYYQQTLKSQFCTVTGDEQKIRESHPAKLLYSGDKAKLISSNDKEGFTYLGRFEEANQATTISAEVSHKAHAALRWLIDRQTTARNNEQVTIAWAISCNPVPSPMKDISSEINWDNLDISAVENPDEFSSQTSSEQPSPDWSVNIGRAAAQIIKKKLHGYQAELKAHEQISLIMLDSATPGRMALTYYQEFLPADYFANLDAWIDDFSWYQRYSIEVPNGKKTTSAPNGVSSRRRLTALPMPCTENPCPTRSKNSFMPAFCLLSQAEHPCRFLKIWCVKVFRQPATRTAVKTGNGKETSALPAPYTKAGAPVITIYHNGELTL